MPKLPKAKAISHPHREEPPAWSWEEHGHQPFQRAEHMEHRVGIVLGVVAVAIALAMAARLIAPYFGYNF
ncbi:MAG TPA: hypothetical protein VFN88_14035 [Caulobacteraceae bacterium]|nr:hypothetical protein [Caulobacteraceae bacterium]